MKQQQMSLEESILEYQQTLEQKKQTKTRAFLNQHN